MDARSHELLTLDNGVTNHFLRSFFRRTRLSQTSDKVCTFLLRVEQSRLGFSSPQISNTKDDQLLQLCTGGGDLTDAYANNKEL